MKKLITLLLSMIILIGLTGCSKNSEITLGSFERNTSTKMTMSHQWFSGSKEREITVEAGETLEVLVDIKTESGTLDAYIINEDGEYNYEGHDVQTDSFTVTLSEEGTYTIRVEAKKHKGSFSFTWE